MKARGSKTVALRFAPLIVIALIFGAYVNYALPASVTNVASVGSVRFSNSWHYVGNVTLSGAQSACEVMRLPCTANPSNTAMEFGSGASIAYVEMLSVNNVEYTIVLINGQPYCVSPKVQLQHECPSMIGTVNIAKSSENATAHTTNSALGLEFVLTLNSTMIRSGEAINVSMAVSNVLPKVNNVSTEKDWALPALLRWWPCTGISPAPMYFAMFQGYYTMANVSSATPLPFFPPGSAASCPASRSPNYFLFEPSGDEVIGFGGHFSMTTSESENGYYSTTEVASYEPNATQGTVPAFLSFSPGVYTIAAGDEWGDVVTLHLVVEPPRLTNLAECANPQYIQDLALRIATTPKFVQAENDSVYTLAYGYNETNRVETVNGTTTLLPNAAVVVFIGYGDQKITCGFRNETVSMLEVTVPVLKSSSSNGVEYYYDMPQMSIDYAPNVSANATMPNE